MSYLEHVRHMAKQLQAAIRASGWTQNRVEQELGWGQGYLSQLIRGSFELKVRHVYQVLELIGWDPRVFFRDLYRSRILGMGEEALADFDYPAEREKLFKLVDERVAEILEQWRSEDEAKAKVEGSAGPTKKSKGGGSARRRRGRGGKKGKKADPGKGERQPPEKNGAEG